MKLGLMFASYQVNFIKIDLENFIRSSVRLTNSFLVKIIFIIFIKSIIFDFKRLSLINKNVFEKSKKNIKLICALRMSQAFLVNILKDICFIFNGF